MSIQQQALPQQKTKSSLITTGLALFSMFFGAGNLIFPLMIGKGVGQNVWVALSGLGITAVVVPFLGLAAMLLFQGDYKRFFGRVGTVPGFLLLLLLQLILGPMGVLPRLVTLMHAIAGSYFGNPSLLVFSLGTAALIFVCSLKQHRLIGILGAVLTPILLLSLGALVFLGLVDAPSLPLTALSASSSFFQGLLGGYNTMDLIAAFLFATVVLPHFQKETEGEYPEKREKSGLRKMFFSSLIAAVLLFLTYVGLCLVSAHHGASFDSLPPEQLLSSIASKLLGPAGAAIAAVAVITACLTTALTLASIFTSYLSQDLSKGNVSKRTSLMITLAVTTLFANLGFSGIAAFLSPLLQIVYPGLIVLTLMNLLNSLYGYQRVKLPVFLTFGISTCMYVFERI